MPLVSLGPDLIAALLEAPLAIVVPVYNESETIQPVIGSWMQELDRQNVDYQFILLNDGSSDATLKVLEQISAAHPRRMVVVDKTNAGHGRTCRLGYDAAAAAPRVEWVLQIDSDGQCDPSCFPEFWRLRAGADCIFGRRLQRDDGPARALTSQLCRLGASLLSGCDLEDPNVPYRLIRREVLASALRRIPASFNIHNVALTVILRKTPGIRWSLVPIRFLQRQGGKNSINLLNVIHWGIDMLLELRRLR